MDPSIFDAAGPWSNLWIISSAVFALVWAAAIAAALTAAAAIPYLTAKLIIPRTHGQRTTKSSRALIPAAAAVIVVIAGIVVFLAYSAGAASGYNTNT